GLDLCLELLGRFRVSVGERVVDDDAWRLRKAAAIVKLLALAPEQRLHRDQVLEWLWPDLSARSAGNNLKYTLHAARAVLDGTEPGSGAWLQLRDEHLALRPPADLWIDVAAFEA